MNGGAKATDQWRENRLDGVRLVAHRREREGLERRGRDSNSRRTFALGGFQDRCLKPLGHHAWGRKLLACSGLSNPSHARSEIIQAEAELAAAKVVGPIAGRTEITLTLPTGWRVQLPPAVEVTGKWGHYAAHYTQLDQTLPVVREVEGARGVYPPSGRMGLGCVASSRGADDVA